MSSWDKLRLLPPSDRVLLVKAGLLVVSVRLGLWVLPFRTLRRVLAKLSCGAPTTCEEESSVLRRVRWAVKTTSRRVPQATCLTQALAVQTLLSRAGIPAQLHIGVTKNAENKLCAHAWVECRGQVVVGEHTPALYTPLLVLDQNT